MTKEQFLKESLVSLQKLTGIHNAQWCRYLKASQGMSVKTLKKAATKLKMTEQDLLDAIETRKFICKGSRYDVRRLG